MKTITEKQKKEHLVQAILLREKEIHHYQVNIDIYKSVLAKLPQEWPEHLVTHRKSEHHAAVGKVSVDQVGELSDLLHRDRIAHLLNTELHEQRRSQMMYDALCDQFSDKDELAAMLAEAANNNGVAG